MASRLRHKDYIPLLPYKGPFQLTFSRTGYGVFLKREQVKIKAGQLFLNENQVFPSFERARLSLIG